MNKELLILTHDNLMSWLLKGVQKNVSIDKKLEVIMRSLADMCAALGRDSEDAEVPTMPEGDSDHAADNTCAARWGDDHKAIAFLRGRGYRLDRSWCWLRPNKDHTPTEDEWSAATYLFEEWDFGGIVLN